MFHRVVLFDQRHCGQSAPHASDLDTDLTSNTTAHLIADTGLRRESATLERSLTNDLAERFTDPAYALAFARIVIHYVVHNGCLEDGALIRGADVLSDIPGVLVNGRFDFQASIGNAWELKRVWSRADLVIVDDAGHSGSPSTLSQEMTHATDRFAVPR